MIIYLLTAILLMVWLLPILALQDKCSKLLPFVFLFLLLLNQLFIVLMFLTLRGDYGGDPLHMLLAIPNCIYSLFCGICILFKRKWYHVLFGLFLIYNGGLMFYLINSVSAIPGLIFSIVNLVIEVTVFAAFLMLMLKNKAQDHIQE